MSLGYDSQINSLIYKMSLTQRDRFIIFLEELKNEGLLIISENHRRKITTDDVIKSVNSITKYEILRALADKAVENGETTIPIEDWGVHITHCCSSHGCKYGDADCPVATKLVAQKYPCEDCGEINDWLTD